MNFPTVCYRPLAIALLGVTGLSAHAFEQKLSGFGTIAAGETFGACTQATTASFSEPCTRFIADWAHAGVYTPELSARAESRIGLQWTGTFTESLSATAQGVGRLTAGTKADVEWAYLTDKINSSWTLQIGRKRLPLYYYSDFQDVGYAYTMVRPSPDVYGWDVVNYNGANLDYAADFGAWSVRASLYGGNEDSRKNKYSTLVSSDPLDIKWKDIVGGSIEASRDWLTLRTSYTQSKMQSEDKLAGGQQMLPSGVMTGRQDFYGIAAIVDYEDWLGRAELAASDRSDQGYKAHFLYVNAGRRFGDFTTMLQYSQYFESSTVGVAYAPIHNRALSATLRYEVSKSSDLKLQFDRDIDTSSIKYTGSANVLSLAYDFVF